MKSKSIFLALLGISCSGCAGITVQALAPDGSHSSGMSGLRYYMPRPYLLVTASPAESTASTPTQPAEVHAGAGAGKGFGTETPRNGMSAPPPPAPARAPSGASAPRAGAADSQSSQSQSTSNTTSDAAAPSQSTDTSYSQTSSSYQVKLVYLPDLGRLMTITQRSGLFGSASSQPTLVNGWMLSSLQGTADNKVAETLSAVGSIVGAIKGTGSKSSTTTTAGGANDQSASTFPSQDWLLPPGLYGFEYDNETGLISSLCVVSLFSSTPPSGKLSNCSHADRVNAAGPWKPVTAQ